MMIKKNSVPPLLQNPGLRERILQGDPEAELWAYRLLEAYLGDKAGAFPNLDVSVFKSIPESRVSLPLEDLMRAFLSAGYAEILFEYWVILGRKGLELPANLVPLSMDATKLPYKTTLTLQKVLGAAGQWLCRENPDWHWILSESEEKAFSFQDPHARMFCLRQWMIRDSGRAARALLDCKDSLPPREFEKLWTSLFHYAAAAQLDSDWLIAALPSKWAHLAWPFLMEDSRYSGLPGERLAQFRTARDPMMLGLPSLRKSGKPLSPADSLRLMPPDLIFQHPAWEQYLDLIAQAGLLEGVIQSVSVYENEACAGILCDWMIRKSWFKEDQKVELLSPLCNFQTFNACAIRFLQQEKENADLEALYRFMNAGNHFWDDRLLDEIIRLNGNSKLEGRFELEVFFNLIPFRINPATDLMQKIPASVRRRINVPMTPEKILNFRKLMRQ